MRIALLALLALAAAALIRKGLHYSHLSPMLPRWYNFGRRGITLRETLRLLSQRKCKVLVETAVARSGLENTKGDGGSTVVFALWAKAYDAKLYSVDIDGGAIANAKTTLDKFHLSDWVELTTSDSVAYLSGFEQQVDFLYLNRYDYRGKGAAIDPSGQERYLEEFKAIESRLHEGSLVLIDDRDPPSQDNRKRVIDYMLGRGWRIHMSKFQVLLTRT